MFFSPSKPTLQVIFNMSYCRTKNRKSLEEVINHHNEQVRYWNWKRNTRCCKNQLIICFAYFTTFCKKLLVCSYFYLIVINIILSCKMLRSTLFCSLYSGPLFHLLFVLLVMRKQLPMCNWSNDRFVEWCQLLMYKAMLQPCSTHINNSYKNREAHRSR